MWMNKCKQFLTVGHHAETVSYLPLGALSGRIYLVFILIPSLCWGGRYLLLIPSTWHEPDFLPSESYRLSPPLTFISRSLRGQVKGVCRMLRSLRPFFGHSYLPNVCFFPFLLLRYFSIGTRHHRPI